MIGKLLAWGSAAWLAGDVLKTLVVKKSAFDHATSLVKDKGIINLGAGTSKKLFNLGIPYSDLVVVNTDISLDGLPNFLQANVEDELPFDDKQFDVSFASHILEHLENWEYALSEWRRISDYTVIVLPSPASITGILHPEHRQHFGYGDIESIGTLPDTFVFY